MKVLLITPYGFQNIGVRLLAAVLQRAGFDAQVLFFKGWRNNDVQPPTVEELALLDAHVRAEAPGLIGFGFGTPYLSLVTELTHRLRRVSQAHIVWGGVHPTIVPDDGVEVADSVCVGEGEGPILDLAAAVRDGRPAAGIDNLWVRTKDGLAKGAMRPLIDPLDHLPWERLFAVDTVVIEDNTLRRGEPQQDNALYRVMASRGCPFRCSFCYNSQYRNIYKGLGGYHRTRTVDSVLDELAAVVASRPRLRRIRFDDDTFVFPRRWVETFCRDYPRRIGLPFDILLNPNAANERTLRALADAGLVHVQIGIQGGSEQGVADQYNRHDSHRRLRQVASLLRDLAVDVTYDVILDNPLESDADRAALLDLLLSLPRPFSLFLYSLTVFPRSEIADRLLSAGLITEDQIEGRATKSFRQFRFSFDYPRPPSETAHAALVSLTSKGFVPRPLVRALAQSETLRCHPAPLRALAEATNLVKLAQVGLTMLRRGELSRFKLKEYASFRRRIIQ